MLHAWNIETASFPKKIVEVVKSFGTIIPWFGGVPLLWSYKKNNFIQLMMANGNSSINGLQKSGFPNKINLELLQTNTKD